VGGASFGSVSTSSGPVGPLVNKCPGPESALPCVPSDQCDPYTGYVTTDGETLPHALSPNTPTVAVTPCRLPPAGVGVCCRRLPRPQGGSSSGGSNGGSNNGGSSGGSNGGSGGVIGSNNVGSSNVGAGNIDYGQGARPNPDQGLRPNPDVTQKPVRPANHTPCNPFLPCYNDDGQAEDAKAVEDI